MQMRKQRWVSNSDSGRDFTYLWRGAERPAKAVREHATHRYEPEGSERRTLGSVSVSAGSWWHATLTVPIRDANAALVTIKRHGDLPTGYRVGEEPTSFAVPAEELGAIVQLLTGVVDQAHGDGVLPPRRA
jgi:hypothetical protein